MTALRFVPRPQGSERQARVRTTDPIKVRVRTSTGSADVLISLRVDGRRQETLLPRVFV